MIRSNDIHAILENSKKQLADLIKRRDELNVDILRVQNEVRQLTAIAWRDELSQRQNAIRDALVGLSDAIRSLMRLNGTPMTPAQVKAALTMMGYDFKDAANPSAIVHNTLKRLHSSGELVFDPRTKTYQLGSQFYKDFYGG
jgi:hypothetical protein